MLIRRYYTPRRWTLLPTLIVVFCMLGTPQTRAANDYEQIRLLFNTISIVNKYYFREVPAGKLIQGAIKGLTQSLDPGCAYLSPELMDKLHEQTEAKLSGVGVEIALKDGDLTIVAPVEGGPAYNAGLKPGDKIVRIDGKSTTGINLLDAIAKMRGPEGKEITFTIMRDDFSKPKDIKMIREPLRNQPMLWLAYLGKGYAYVRIVSFAKGLDQQMIAAIESYGGAKSIKGMIIDLRNSPGGLFQESIRTADLFLKEGLILSTKGRVERASKEYNATSTDNNFEFKVVILTNVGSAGASEIFAGALQDHGRALVIGEQSFGRGTIQSIIPMSDGSGIQLTTAEFLTPKGNPIDGRGITPDVKVDEISKTDEVKKSRKPNPETDKALKKALDWLKSGENISEIKKMQTQ